MRSEYEVNRAIQQHGDMVRRLCMLHLKNYADMEDIFQTVFLKYALSSTVFASPQHENAWFVRVTLNACKDLLKSFHRRCIVSLEELQEIPQPTDIPHREVLDAVLALPEKYRITIYLHYYEGYTAPEIAKITRRTVSGVYTLLARGKTMLKEALEHV